MIASHHVTDRIPDPLHPRNRRRTIGNYINYRTPGGLWAPTAPGIGVSSDRRPVFPGAGAPVFSRASEAGPLQFWCGDSSDPGNTTTVAMSSDTTPDASYAITLSSPDAVVAMQESGATSYWPGVVTNGTLRWIHGGHQAKCEIELSEAGHAFAWRFKFRLAPGCTFSLANNVYLIRNPAGTVVFVGRAPFGYDANGKRINCTLTQVGTWGPGGAWPEVELAAEQADFAGAVYPVTIDPSTNIPDSSIEDNYYQENNPNGNYGAATTIAVRNGAGVKRKSLLRIDESLVPSGTVTSFRLNLTLNVTPSVIVEAYKIAAANAAWVEGTATGAAETGSPCFNYLAYDASTPTSWAGSAGLETSGTDYIADASPPSIGPTLTTTETITLLTAWAEDWRDNPGNNAGHLLVLNSGYTTNVSFDSCEDATPSKRPNYDIDYTEAAFKPFLFSHRVIQ